MPLVTQRRDFSADLGLETAHLRVIPDNELGRRPDANAGHDGVGGWIAGRESFLYGVVQFVCLFHGRPRSSALALDSLRATAAPIRACARDWSIRQRSAANRAKCRRSHSVLRGC